jgi:hypothetical protein
VHIPEVDSNFYTERMIERDMQESIANANLIAAAPETAIERDKLKEVNAELLEALKEMVYQYEYEASPLNPALLQAKLVIAKAEGKLPEKC